MKLTNQFREELIKEIQSRFKNEKTPTERSCHLIEVGVLMDCIEQMASISESEYDYINGVVTVKNK